MNASPMSWASAAISVLTLGGMIYTGVFHYASVQADIKTAHAELARNFKEDERRADHTQKMIDKNHEFTVKAVERIDTTINHLSIVNVKISVLETKLEAITDILRRVERQMEKRGPIIDDMAKRK